MQTLDPPPVALPRPATKAGAAPDPGALHQRDLSAWSKTPAAVHRFVERVRQAPPTHRG